jgi:hypothetical protein
MAKNEVFTVKSGGQKIEIRNPEFGMREVRHSS